MKKLPIIILFDAHCDAKSKKVLHKLIPILTQEGYNAYCHEVRPNWSSDEIIEKKKSWIESSKSVQEKLSFFGDIKSITKFQFFNIISPNLKNANAFEEVYFRMLCLESDIAVLDTMRLASRNGYAIKGIDMAHFDRSMNPKGIQARGDIRCFRDQAMAQNMLSLYNTGHGVLASIGAAHASIISILCEHEIQDEIIYRIIFSDDCDKGTLDILNDIVEKFPFLESKKVNLESQASIDACVKDILQEVKLKQDYQYEILEGNTQSRILTGYFGAQFKTMMRKGYYVDAVLHKESKEELQNIHNELMFLGIESSIKKLDSTLSLVITDINTKEVGDKVMSIQNRR